MHDDEIKEHERKEYDAFCSGMTYGMVIGLVVGVIGGFILRLLTE